MKKRTVLRSLGLMVAFFTASVVPSQSNTCTWTNTSGGNWNNANNWSPNQVPSTNDTAVITVAGTYSVTLDVSPTVAGLDLGASAGATAQNLVWAGFALTVNGPI
ncbi:MAG TPA: hypothetical protein VN765_09640, partial [Candidatus Acidoferrum sp.]|nr:hypothetical protein [Candidatus Acidoferrum sp.]